MRKLRVLLILSFAFASAFALQAQAQNVTTTVAGGGPPDGVPATSVPIPIPMGIAVGSSGNFYVAAQSANRVYRVDGSGALYVFAGSGAGYAGDGGLAKVAGLGGPTGLTMDANGNIFIGDRYDHRVRRVDAATQVITTFAGNGQSGYAGDGGPATQASFSDIWGLAVDGSGNLFVSDRSVGVIRRVDGQSGIITTVAGHVSPCAIGDGGTATQACLDSPQGVAVDSTGNLFIAEDCRVRRVDSATAIITTVAGTGQCGYGGDGGPAVQATLSRSTGVSVDSSGNLFIADSTNYRIRRVDATTQMITTVAGNGQCGYSGDGGPATAANICPSQSVAVDASGSLLFGDGDQGFHVRRVDGTGIITTVAGNGTNCVYGDGGPAIGAMLCQASGVAVDSSGNIVIADGNPRIARVDRSSGTITTVVGNPNQSGFGGDGGPATRALLQAPTAVTLDRNGNMFIADSFNDRIRRVDHIIGIISTVAGGGGHSSSGDGGPAILAALAFPQDVAVDGAGNLFIAESNFIRRVDGVTGIISTVAGNHQVGGSYCGDGGPANAACLFLPDGVTVDSNGNLYIADTYNHRVRRVDASTGIITTFAGTGSQGFGGDGGPAAQATLRYPSRVTFDANGNLFIADSGNSRVRRVDAATGIISTFVGTQYGFGGDGGPASLAKIASGAGMVWDSNNSGNFIFVDSGNNRIRIVTPGP